MKTISLLGERKIGGNSWLKVASKLSFLTFWNVVLKAGKYKTSPGDSGTADRHSKPGTATC